MTSTPPLGVEADSVEADSTQPYKIMIRPIADLREFEECVTLQLDTWGQGFSDVVPVSLLQITQKMGGVVSGAFDERGKLIGVVYGITGVMDGELAHWSHMLAVREEARNGGVGQRLKLHQRELLKKMNVGVMYWTFDPLVARNAHLNLNRLGAHVREFVPNMYGDSDSDLHRLGTDRFVARWELNAATPEPAETVRPSGENQIDNSYGGPGAPDLPNAPVVTVVIPQDIEALEAKSFDEAMEWRTSTRRAFGHYLNAGYRVSGFIPGDRHGRYLLTTHGS